MLTNLKPVTYLPSIVSGSLKNRCGSATNLVPSTTRVTLSGSDTFVLYLDDIPGDTFGVTLYAAGENADEVLCTKGLNGLTSWKTTSLSLYTCTRLSFSETSKLDLGEVTESIVFNFLASRSSLDVVVSVGSALALECKWYKSCINQVRYFATK